MSRRCEAVEPLARRLGDGVSERELADAWRTIEARRARGVARWPVWGALAAIGIIALLARRPEASPPTTIVHGAQGPLARAAGDALDGIAPRERVTLQDGSVVETDATGALEVLANDAHEVALHLRAGGARFSIVPGGPRRWRVEGGGVSVEVVGTVFSVRRDGERVHVDVERGVVVVRGAAVGDGVRRLVAGEAIEVGGETVAAPIAVPIAVPLARTPAGHSAETLMDEADRARREGRIDDAIETLGRVVERHPRSAEAPLAAFTRARLLTAAGRVDEARASYERALALGLPPALEGTAREALAP